MASSTEIGREHPVTAALRAAPIDDEPDMLERKWSPMQQAIFAAVADLPAGKHLVVEALAGTGKSTTIREAVERVPARYSVLVCAFNKAIAEELRGKLPDDVECLTLHALGMRICSSAGYAFDEKRRYYVGDLAKQKLGRNWESLPPRRACEKIVSLAKGTLTDSSIDALGDLADDYEIDLPTEFRGRVLSAVGDILEACPVDGCLDFDDMIWLPEVLDLPTPTWDYVFVDETQDLNAAQLALACRVAGSEGRIVAVGDRRQAIYGFRGADRKAIPRMISKLNATVLPLSITYRCPRAVVREAHGGTQHASCSLVPALEAAPNAPDGIVREATLEHMREHAAAGDMVLSRTNAPLIREAFKWLSKGKRARIQGRDIGAGLQSWIKGVGASSVSQLVRAAEEWAAREIARLAAAEKPTDAVQDRCDCVRALCEGAPSVAEVIARCERLFADNGEPGILLCSTHRAKGLEAERVWLLRETYLRFGSSEEERNLLYVAISRSKHELIYVYEKVVP